MKLTILFLFLVFQLHARSFSQQLTIDAKQISLDLVFKMINEQTGYDFIYNPEIIKNFPKKDINVENVPLRQFLNNYLHGSSLKYEFKYNHSIALTAVVIDKDVLQSTLTTKSIFKLNGKVIGETGLPLPNVNIRLKNRSTGTTSNTDGSFTIEVNLGDVLIFSSLGFDPKEISVSDNTTLTVVLKEKKSELNTVVVTALGIKQSVKALTYNVQDVKGKELTLVPDASFVNSLAGKVAGVTINSSSSGIGGSTKVVLRGDKSINSNNNALYVLDGIPLPSLTSSVSNGRFGGSDHGDGISDLSPEDIASVDILTGPASAALYGSLAAQGAILVTTKNGKSGQTNIDYSNSLSFYKPFVLPQFQDTYGTSSPGNFDSWGLKLANPNNYNPADFFQTGISEFNSIGLSTGTEKNATYFSAASFNSRGIIQNNTFDRYNLTLKNTAYLIKDKLTFDASIFYTNKKVQNPLTYGEYTNPLVPIYLFPRGDDISKYKVFERYNPALGIETQFWPSGYSDKTMQNPYWIDNRILNNNTTDRYITSGSLNYKALSWLNLSARVRFDNNNTTNIGEVYASTLPLFSGNSSNGNYGITTGKNNQLYADFLATIHENFGPLSISSNIGGSILNNRFGTVQTGGTGLAQVPNLFTLNNVVPGPDVQSDIYTQLQAIYATAQLGYKNMLYVDVTGRNEWSSTLATVSNQNTSFFYPSVGLSAILTDIFHIESNTLSYLKIRGNFANVGNGIQPYVGGPIGYTVDPSGVSLNANLPLVNLKPERTRSEEIGLNANFLKNTISLGVTLYNSNSFNQLFTFTAPVSSGFNSFYVNAGNINNKGIEATLGYKSSVGNVFFSSTAVFSLNRNKVISLVDNALSPINGGTITQNSFSMGGTGSFTNIVNKGGSLGDIYVNKLAVDENGYIYVDEDQRNLTVDNTDLLKAGNSNPRFNVGLRNEINYKHFSLNFLVDGRFGGVVVSQTQAAMDGYGVSLTSAKARDSGGVLINGSKYDAQKYYQFVGLGNTILSPYVYSATNIRLREVAIGYTLPTKLFKNRIKNITISLIGRNVFMFYNKAPFDPETTASTGTYFQGIDYFMQPSLRSVGLSLKSNF